MKTEKSILLLTSLSLLAFAIFTSYNTPPVDRSFKIESQLEIENYKLEMADKISTDKRKMKELKSRYELEKGERRRADEDRLIALNTKFNELQTVLNNYEANDWEEWQLFKERFDGNFNDQHESLIQLIVKTSNGRENNSIQSLVKP